MGWLNFNGLGDLPIEPVRAAGPFVPVLPAGYRSGAPVVPAPASMQPNRYQAWDRTSPLVAAPNWTPWGYLTPPPGRTMESF
jgi:hypothetical protein